ncbi:MAG: citrate lyase acyl carrier protein [Eubacteriales bacterium]|nr:citrate lyase acyl carrier protein [Eubacteriales bacterium]
MQLQNTGIAGTMESGDILIEVEKKDGPGVEVSLESTVGNQYGAQIKQVIRDTVASCGVDGVRVKAVDKGSLDCTIRARVTAAVHRTAGNGEYTWQ